MIYLLNGKRGPQHGSTPDKPKNRRVPPRSWKPIPDDFIGKGVWRKPESLKLKKVPVKVIRHLGYKSEDRRNHVRVEIVQKTSTERIGKFVPSTEIFYRPLRKRGNRK